MEGVRPREARRGDARGQVVGGSREAGGRVGARSEGAGPEAGAGPGGSREGRPPRGASRSRDGGRQGRGPPPRGALREIPGLLEGPCGLRAGAGGGLLPAVPVRRILMLEPFLRVPGFDISRQRSGSRGSSAAAAPRPGPARPRRRRRLKVTAPGWAPGSEPGHKLRGPGVRTAGRWSSRGIGARPGAPDPRSLPAEPSPEPPPLPPPPPPQSRTPAALAASAAAASRSRARARRRAGPALRAPAPCGPAPACVRAPAGTAGRGSEHARVAGPAPGRTGSQSRWLGRPAPGRRRGIGGPGDPARRAEPRRPGASAGHAPGRAGRRGPRAGFLVLRHILPRSRFACGR